MSVPPNPQRRPVVRGSSISPFDYAVPGIAALLMVVVMFVGGAIASRGDQVLTRGKSLAQNLHGELAAITARQKLATSSLQNMRDDNDQSIVSARIRGASLASRAAAARNRVEQLPVRNATERRARTELVNLYTAQIAFAQTMQSLPEHVADLRVANVKPLAKQSQSLVAHFERVTGALSTLKQAEVSRGPYVHAPRAAEHVLGLAEDAEKGALRDRMKAREQAAKDKMTAKLNAAMGSWVNAIEQVLEKSAANRSKSGPITAEFATCNFSNIETYRDLLKERATIVGALNAIPAASPEAAAAQTKLAVGLNESIAANSARLETAVREYAMMSENTCHAGDANEHDTAASAAKAEFVAKYGPLASPFGKGSWSPDQF